MPFIVADFEIPPIGCSPFAHQFNNTSLTQANTSYFWDFGDGDTSTQFEPNHTYTQPGTYTLKLILTDNTSCNLSDTLQKDIIIIGDTTFHLNDVASCAGETNQIGVLPNPDPTLTYLWTPSNGLSNSTVSNPFASPIVTTSYQLLISNGVCTDTIMQTVTVGNPLLTVSNDTTLCADTLNLILSANSFGTSNTFIWSTNLGFSDTLNMVITDSNVALSPVLPGNLLCPD